MKYYQEFSVSGVANSEVLDVGLTSTEAEKKRCTAIYVTTNDYVGNIIVARLEREKILGIYDYIIDTYSLSGSTNTVRSTTKLNRIEIGVDIPVGRTLKVGISCGANATRIYGAYEYEII
jgi:hypothetical protein